MEIDPAQGATLSPSQSVQLMALGVLIRDGDLALRGDDAEDVANGEALLIDVSQEIALQMGAEPEASNGGD